MVESAQGSEVADSWLKGKGLRNFPAKFDHEGLSLKTAFCQIKSREKKIAIK